MSGLDRLSDPQAWPASAARVGLLCHHASVTRDGRHAVEVLRNIPGVALHGLFTPEHGFSGTAAAGEPVGHGTFDSSGLPMYSLYGDTRSPKAEWLQDLDLVVADLMDLGVRCYTYASTLMLMMRACSTSGLPLLVLDRSTPLQGVVDGPDLDEACISFVGQVPLPLVYGKSQGALARHLQQTLPEFEDLQLSVLSVLPGDAPPWIPPSPAIVSPDAARAYPVTVWSEAIPKVWVDRGGPLSFQVWAMPDFPSLDPAPLQGYGFRVEAAQADTPDGIWPGLRFRVSDPCALRPVSLAHALLQALCQQLGPERLFKAPGARPGFFDQLAGTPSWRQCLIQGRQPAFITSPNAL